MSMQIPLAVVGFLVPIGIVSLTYAIYQEMTDVAESMDEDSKAYDAYVNSPVPTYQSIYMFNLTNYEDILRGKRPIVTELGPYVFKTVTQRNSSWYHDLVETTEVNAYYFEPNMSKGTLDDTIFTIDLYAITLLDMLQEKPHLKNISGNMTVFFNMTVRKLLYEGYEENNEWADILRFPGSLVSYLRPNNGSITKYQVYTGRSGRSKDTNAYYSWQNSKTLNYFKPACSNLDGTNGEFYQPTLYPPLIVKIFRRSLCKPWRLYLKDRFLRLGEPIVRYKALADLFSETGDPALDSCYSPNPTHRQGTFDATLCYMQDHNLTRYASQVILSSPHFLNGDPTLTQQISGLAPNEYEHGFYIDVHAVVFTLLLLMACGCLVLERFVPQLVRIIATTSRAWRKYSRAFQKTAHASYAEGLYVQYYQCRAVPERRPPYCRRTWAVRVPDMSWGGDQLLFDESHTLYFAPELSNGTLDSEIVTVDIVVASVIQMIDELPKKLQLLAKLIIQWRSILCKYKVRELLYDGYCHFWAKIGKIIQPELPMINGKVGFLLGGNASNNGSYTAFSRAFGHASKISMITSLANRTTISYYDRPCNQYSGTSRKQKDGTHNDVVVFAEECFR
ncbi:scavenger receptor class B member 1-like isoform X6 [Varroa destructor]|uniref:Uncharacterized protein n=1 Tax=Varroa destructor TaxID=109461 RepID=A0A7M7M4L6_VARDE|nr:scavenger receptor class B member 1-like isoform X6 [Varroa destructor]